MEDETVQQLLAIFKQILEFRMTLPVYGIIMLSLPAYAGGVLSIIWLNRQLKH